MIIKLIIHMIVKLIIHIMNEFIIHMIHRLITNMIINLVIHMILRLIITWFIGWSCVWSSKWSSTGNWQTRRSWGRWLWSWLIRRGPMSSTSAISCRLAHHHHLQEIHHHQHHYLCHQDKDLNPNFKTYLEPLKGETFLSNTEINALFGNIQEIYGFQQQVRIMKIMNMMLMMLLWVMLCLEISTKSITSRKR